MLLIVTSISQNAKDQMQKDITTVLVEDEVNLR